ncbi:hypothetical protein T440DRAFT_466497 [Plenodomus tracheiphilus IPT5]|uniref:DAGKc domain-containing protein n=1 Tax=Plenodomus tracheiphilus IPT5 TaxID=1408161 RepID=A0A6A7BCD4_9PLEO|nr:hypothetical protein T440DRAFT_466497 [Plenodomus tracheiphilus IPT5]
MADSKAPKQVEQPKTGGIDVKSKDITITLPSPDGASEATVLLEQNDDTTRPPRLVRISKQNKIDPGSTAITEERETHIIVSTGSGHKQADKFFNDVVSPILVDLYGSEILSKSKKHITQSETSVLEFTNDLICPQANDGRLLRIILASGDGGIVDLVNGLLAKPAGPSYVSPQVIILPLGTANALYHSINAGKDNTWGLQALSSSIAKPLPVFTASFSPGARLLVDEARKEEELPKDSNGTPILHGAVVCSWGMHASLVADSDTTAYRKFGIDRFKMAATEALYPADGSLPHPYKGSVSILKSEKWTPIPQEEHLYVLATLVSNLEQPFCISPDSKPLDGSLRLVHFGPTTGDDAMRIMGLAYQGGKHVQDEKVRYEDIDGLKIEFQGKEEDARWRRICIDGKIVRVEKDGWVELRKEERRALDVVVAP